MKKILLTILFFIIIIPGSVYAQEDLSIPTQGITPSPTPLPTIINYELPYPGLLPGSPLYSLKAIRDRVLELFTSDPLKRSNFYLLQADKRLASAISLFVLNKDEVAETTLSKGQNYLEKSLENAQEAKKRGKNISDILAKIRMSSAKQKEQILIISKTSKGEIQQKLLQDLKRAEDLQKRAERVKS
ncbi:MAG: DUF5667 domain-containing protein [Patescibacteria group bacterium]